MKKYFTIFCITLFLSFIITATPSVAQPKSYRQGIYTEKSLDLHPDTSHTIQNNSPSQYAFVILLDSNQIVQQLIQLEPMSDKYNLEPLLAGYVLIIVGKDEVLIS
ncbi:hypothetical protein [Clostridium saccharobutylicum]|uniref:Uncharacterized protein n=1 Tax=Clostridium saccharobutylicum TaxID=169679 RepID=A0A1S8NH61_CLOSA|nr:hypothetical protein [Clostridium saccharobutylicum]OOM15748.1 hypothetical protein CLOSAC_00190 [Clostridium saccharobutylicum]